jgi:siroheme synthase
MGRARLAEVATAMIGAGRSPDTPAACIERGTLPGQRTVRATLSTIASAADAAALRSPMVTVIGDVAALALPVSLPC